MEQAEAKARNEKKRAELEIQKARKKEIDNMKENQSFFYCSIGKHDSPIYTSKLDLVDIVYEYRNGFI